MKSGMSKFPAGSILCTWAAVFLALMPTLASAGGGQLLLTVVDQETRRPIPCRMHLSRADGRSQKLNDYRLKPVGSGLS